MRCIRLRKQTECACCKSRVRQWISIACSTSFLAQCPAKMIPKSWRSVSLRQEKAGKRTSCGGSEENMARLAFARAIFSLRALIEAPHQHQIIIEWPT